MPMESRTGLATPVAGIGTNTRKEKELSMNRGRGQICATSNQEFV